MIGPRYDLYYAEQFPMERLEAFHRDLDRDPELRRFVGAITAHIAEFGLRNPPVVYRRGGRLEVRPGKCRVTAFRRLGYLSIPALVVDYDRSGPEKGWIPLPHDAAEVQKLFTGDCVVEMSRRFFSVKKNVDVVHRPGAESPYEADLRSVAQRVERRAEDAGVGGANPS